MTVHLFIVFNLLNRLINSCQCSLLFHICGKPESSDALPDLSLSFQVVSSSPASSNRDSSLASFPSCHWRGLTWSAAFARSCVSGASVTAATWWSRSEETWSTLLSRDSTSPPLAVKRSLQRSASFCESEQDSCSDLTGGKAPLFLFWEELFFD